MTVDAAVARFRHRQYDVMRDEANVTRTAGPPVFNPGTGSYATPSSTTYTGRCLIRPYTNIERVAGDVEVAVVALTVKFPVDADVERGDTVTVTASAYDSGMVGRTFTVREVSWDGWQISRKAIIEEAQG